MTGSAGTANSCFIKHKQYQWIPARLLEQDGKTAKVSVPQYPSELDIMCDDGAGATGWKEETVKLKDYDNNTLPLQNSRLVQDMVDLPYLHEAAILYNIKSRHNQEFPYTRTGDIVIAINPYQWLTYLYTGEAQVHYANKIVWENHDGDPRKLVEPHVYETSSLCYKGLARDRQDQSILVSGESGAGKTETVKIAMNHMASLQRGPVSAAESKEAYVSEVVQRVVESNPLLEVFGNAKTRRNDNSSRFGKYISLQFDKPAPEDRKPVPTIKLAGSKCEVYLLEKSRICFHDETERTYHVFYQLIGAPDDLKTKVWKELKGVTNESFAYVGHTDFTTFEGKFDGDCYADTCAQLATVGITEENGHLMTLFRAIAAVLQLGNLQFGAKGGDNDKSEITSKKEVKALAELLGVGTGDLDLALTERTVRTRGEEYKVPLNPATAKDTADAFAKEIYARLFLWLVRAINDATCAELNYDGENKTNFGLIGLLDIFGFESFPINGFEQLCINYANEKLQQKFTQDIFRAVLEEYKFEGIDIADVTYEDNTPVLNLIEGKGGFLAMLNEECVRPKGNDATFVNKAVTAMKKNPVLHHTPRMGPLDFGINHYAGPVQYFAQDFVTRNTDTLPQDLQDLAKKTTNEIIAKHLQNDAMMNGEVKKEAKAAKGPKRSKSSLTGDTVWTKFKTQLNSLMTNLSTTRSRYIRCIKPNTLKKPRVMQNGTTVDQLRCAGVVSAVTISRSAYPNRLDHGPCLQRFKCLWQGRGGAKFDNERDEAEAMCKNILEGFIYDNDPNKTTFAIGKTKSYFRAGALEFLESKRVGIFDKWAVHCQRVARGGVVRIKIRKVKYARFIEAALPVQMWWRCIRAKRKLQKLKREKKLIARLKKKSKKQGAKVTNFCRMVLCRLRYIKMRDAFREENKLCNRIKRMEKAMQEAEERRLKEVAEAEEAAKERLKALREQVKEEMKDDDEKKKKSAQQQTLIDESGRIIEYLRKENMKLRSTNDSMKKDFKELKENNARLMEANASAGKSFTALNDHAKQLNEDNAKLIGNVNNYKKQLQKLKEDLKTRQAYYLAEAEARLAFQKTLAKIVGTVQDECRDQQLIEDVVIMALECEAEAKSERAALDAATSKSSGTQATADESDSD